MSHDTGLADTRASGPGAIRRGTDGFTETDGSAGPRSRLGGGRVPGGDLAVVAFPVADQLCELDHYRRASGDLDRTPDRRSPKPWNAHDYRC